MVEPEERALIEQLIAHSAVETFAEAILHGLAWRDEVPGDPVLLRPAEQGVRGELGAVIGNDHAGLAPLLDQCRQFACYSPF